MSLPKLKNESVIKALYTRPTKEKIYPTYQIHKPNVLHEIDVLYFTNDNGYKYILSVIDVYNSLAEARPLKTLTMTEIMKQLDDIYIKSKCLNDPKILQADSEFNNVRFHKYCEKNNIKLKITEPYHHRQNSHVERLNQSIQKILWEHQLDKEIETKQINTSWVGLLKSVITHINSERLKSLDDNYMKKNVKWTNQIKLTSKTPTLIQNGTDVRIKLDEPETIQGEKLHGKFRKVDTKWKYKPTYKVVDSLLTPNTVPLYHIKNNDTNKKINHLMPAESLQIIQK